MHCPKCHCAMEEIHCEGSLVDRCTLCGGLWFDSGISQALRKPKWAAAIDIGDPEHGEHTNAIDRYPCPSCSGTMIRMVDARQTHIWFEKCSACGGSFLDAGEFRDLAKWSISDFFKDLSTPERN